MLLQVAAPPAIATRAAPRARPVAMTHTLKACMPRSQRAALATAPRARQMRLGRVVSVRAEEGDAAVVKVEAPKTGTVSKYLAQNGLKHKSLGFDYQGVEMVQVMREDLMAVCAAIYTDGWNYLRNQCGYDSEPGGDLVSVYHLCKMDPETNDSTPPPEEVCIKVFLPRDDPTCPSVFSIWQTADWQERETYDMYGIVYENHPKLIRILMPEHWEGWPMRKDYITPDFYELQDAY